MGHFQTGSILAGSGSIPAEREAPGGTLLNGYVLQTTPGDAVRKIHTTGLIIQIRGSDGHVHCAPSDVRQAAVPHIARTEVLEVAVDARGAFVLTSAISSASNDVVGAEAQTTQLPVQDPADVCALLAGTMHDVSKHRCARDGRVYVVLP